MRGPTAPLVGAVALAAMPNRVTGAVVFDDGFGAVRGVGDPDLLSLLSYARRSLGELDSSSSSSSSSSSRSRSSRSSGGALLETEYQTLPQLYSGAMGGLLEGPTWGAYWTQNRWGAGGRFCQSPLQYTVHAWSLLGMLAALGMVLALALLLLLLLLENR